MEDVSATHELLTAQREGRTPARSALLKRYFLLSLLLSTWVPVIFFMLLAPSGTSGSGGLWGVKSIFLFLGTAHVPITLFFYTDRDFSGIIKDHKLRYVYLPLF